MRWLTASGRVAQIRRRRGSHSPERWLNSLWNIQIAGSFKFITILSGKDMYYKYPHGDEIYNVMAIYEAQNIQGNPKVNDNESHELKYFSLKEPIENLNPFTEHYLRRAGYIKKW